MSRRTGTRGSWAAIASLTWVVCAAALGGCGASSDAAGLPSGTWATTVTGADEPYNGHWSLTFSRHGSINTVRHNGKGFATEKVVVHGGVVTFSSDRDPRACHLPGKYAFKRHGDRLTFTNVGDTCSGRENMLRHALTRTG